MSPFYVWLEQQQPRTDTVGQYARRSCRKTNYPRLSYRLHVLLKFEHPDHHRPLKRAHREWRRVRKAVVAA